MAVTLTEGLPLQWEHIVGSASVPLADVLWLLTTDTVPYTDSTTLGDVNEAMVGGLPIVINPPSVEFASISSVNGSSTATVGIVQCNTQANNSASTTVTQWIAYSQSRSVGLWAGIVSPPWTPGTFPSGLRLSGLQLTMGTCSPSVALGGLLDGLFDAPVIPSASFTTAPAWPAGTWTGGILASSGSAYEPPGAPPTTQYVVLQGTDTSGTLFSQTFTVPGDSTVRLCGGAAQRTMGDIQSILIEIDGGSVEVLVGSEIGQVWLPWASDTFTLSAGSHTITFSSLTGPPADASLFIAMLSLVPVF